MDPAIESPAWPVEELASRAGLPVRTIREYQTMRVLQPPQRRGRVGFYGEAHLSRLRLIARLQHRGYSLAGIRDLIEAWAAGQDLAGVIDDPEAPLLDEAPVVLDGAELAAALPGVPAARLGELAGLGLVSDCGPDRFCVPSPSLLRLLADATASGVSTDDAFAVLAAITLGVRRTAEAAAATLRDALGGRAGEEATVQLLRRGRGLIAQGTGRLLLHELARALAGSTGKDGDPAMAAVVGRPEWARALCQAPSRPGGLRGDSPMANDAQIEHWNGEQARHWIASRHRHDMMLAPFAERLLQAARLTPATRVLDIGCGCGETTLAASRAAPMGIAAGVDISAPMLDVARHRAAEAGQANICFVEADAQTCPFPPRGFDLAISRFGVMFFDDPVAAFSNIGGALAPGGRLVFACWQGLADNEFVLVPALAMAEHLSPPQQGPPGAPGMFALADRGRTRFVLTSAGFTDVTIDTLPERILLGGGGTLDDAVEFVRRGGMGRAFLASADAVAADIAVAAVRAALAPYAEPDGVRIGAAAWLVSARRP